MPKPLPCPERCNVLLVGGGGREHALAWKMKQSPRLGDLWLTDASNAALAELGTAWPFGDDLSNMFRIRRWCEDQGINLVVVGPEAPLAAGLVDDLADKDRLVFGPSKAAARLEADKAYAKEVMRQAAVPTAEYRACKDAESAKVYAETREAGCVVKASGLAAGKGAIVCKTPEEAIAAIDTIMVERAFGEAGDSVIIEEKLIGQEVSVLAIVDGRTLLIVDPCQDHKQVGEGDVGPNTGGMGAYCPTPLLDAELLHTVESDVFVPTIDALRRDGIEFRGVLYAGLMLTAGGPRVLEFNCRFGDPECQPLMARLQSDLIELLWASCTGRLDDLDVAFDDRAACCVVMCSEGYPGSYPKGRLITGIADAEALGDVTVFHAGTTRDAKGDLVTNGGRVLGVTALGHDLQSARDLANQACRAIHFDGAFFRSDIGDRVLAGSPKV
ncbi:MAG: phosphoribosylamine--glycine ligase [Planctomycetota bacterium]|jgi:phosphoribosylamine--glycine ligase